MKGRFPFISLVAAALSLSAGQARAQFTGDHYVAGTEGIQAGSLPGPGFYFDDINIYAHSTGAAAGTFSANRISSYYNEPRVRWISRQEVLGINFGAELMLPWFYRAEDFPGGHLKDDQFGANDLEIAPLLLSWRLPQFDFSAGYAFWVPTGDNDLFLDHGFALPPIQFHWWENMFTLGGTWHPDAAKKWSLSALNHYEINEPYDEGRQSVRLGQLFTSEWGFSRTVGKYFEAGLIGNYSQQTTKSRYDLGPYPETAFYGYSDVELGPEIKATIPCGHFSASLRYLHEVAGQPGCQLNMVALSLSKRF